MINFTPQAISYIFIGLCFCVIFGLILFKRREKFPYFAAQTLLTAAELQFYKVLKAVTVGRYDISCKVRLGDIIKCTDYYWRKGYGPKISAKHIDFVLHDPDTSEIILCIELDDKSHNRPERVARDKFLNKALDTADVRLLRIPVTRGYDMAKLEKDIVVALK